MARLRDGAVPGAEAQADVLNRFSLREGRVACYEVCHATAALREPLANDTLRNTP
jgi:hypothetical protein